MKTSTGLKKQFLNKELKNLKVFNKKKLIKAPTGFFKKLYRFLETCRGFLTLFRLNTNI